jgi:hypothetical protein
VRQSNVAEKGNYQQAARAIRLDETPDPLEMRRFRPSTVVV